jgi:hypothetical protein
MNEGSDEKVYEEVGISCGTTDSGQEVVGILFPTGIGDESEDRYLTLPAAKALLLDLREAIEVCMEHQSK